MLFLPIGDNFHRLSENKAPAVFGVAVRAVNLVVAQKNILRLIIGPDGKTYDIKVDRSLGEGLDAKAIQAVRKWRFQPALKDGTPVAVTVSIEIAFRLY